MRSTLMTPASGLAAALCLAVGLVAVNPAAAAARDRGEAAKTGAAIAKATAVVDSKTGTDDTNPVVDLQQSATQVPSTTAGEVVVGGSDEHAVRLGLPGSTDSAAEEVSGEAVVYADEAANFDVAVQATAMGARALVTLKDADAPTTYRFPVEGPAGSRLVDAADLLGGKRGTGEVLLLDEDGALVAGFDAAWAVDAKGRSVPTRYSIEGNTLVQTVDVSAKTAFPVVADPSLWQIVKCAASLTWLVGSNLVVVSKIIKIKKYINALGGFRKSASLLLRASTWEERLRIGGGALVGLAAEILGVASVRNNCFP